MDITPGRLIALVVPFVALATVVLLALRPPQDTGALPRGPQVIPVEEREQAPTEPVELLMADGETTLERFRGSVVVLNFWASWCGPCRAEQPELNEAHERLAADGVVFLGVDLQDPGKANGQAHWREFAVPYDSVYDPASQWAAKFRGVGPKAIPTTIVIDEDGRVAVRIFGETTADEVVDAVQQVTRT